MSIGRLTRAYIPKAAGSKVKEVLWDDFFSIGGMDEKEILSVKKLNYPAAFYKPLMFEIIDLYKSEGFGSVMDRLQKSDPEQPLSFVNQGIMNEENKAALELEKTSRKGATDITDGIPCDKCGSTNTTLERKQTRSADEGTSGYRLCLDCNTKKKLG